LTRAKACNRTGMKMLSDDGKEKRGKKIKRPGEDV